MTDCTEWPDGAHAFLSPDQWPLVTVRFADGGQVDFRAGCEWPRSAQVRYSGLDVKGLRVDIDASIGPGGKLGSIWLSKTDVAGADGGLEVPVKVRDTAEALARRRAREARDALGTVTGTRRARAGRRRGSKAMTDDPVGGADMTGNTAPAQPDGLFEPGTAIVVNIDIVAIVYLSQNDIASLLGMGRTMVNVWRARFDDFPEPDAVTGIGKRGIPGWRPERMADIRAWLAAHPRLLQNPREPPGKAENHAAAAV